MQNSRRGTSYRATVGWNQYQRTDYECNETTSANTLKQSIPDIYNNLLYRLD